MSGCITSSLLQTVLVTRQVVKSRTRWCWGYYVGCKREDYVPLILHSHDGEHDDEKEKIKGVRKNKECDEEGEGKGKDTGKRGDKVFD